MTNEEIMYDLSSNLVKDIQPNDVDEDILKKQEYVLKVLLSRFHEELRKEEKHSGIIEVKIKDEFWKDSEEGYREIHELIKKDNFYPFFSKYCIYMKDIWELCDEYGGAYYTLIWNYKEYYESLNKEKMYVKTLDKKLNDQIEKSLVDFRTLPLEYQTEIMISFIKSVTKYSEINLHNIASSICESEGHQFGIWEKKVRIENVDTWMGKKFVNGYPVKRICWSRTCSRCGMESISYNKPQELVDTHKEERKKTRIKRLEEQLKEEKK